jgi:hypothetical protein
MTKNIIPKKEKEQLEQCRDELREKSYKLSELCPGTIQESWLTCGKPNCKCKKENGKKHGPYNYLSFTGRGDKRMVTILVPKEDVSEIEKRINNFRKLEKDVRELVELEFKIKKNLKKTKLK